MELATNRHDPDGASSKTARMRSPSNSSPAESPSAAPAASASRARVRSFAAIHSSRNALWRTSGASPSAGASNERANPSGVEATNQSVAAL